MSRCYGIRSWGWLCLVLLSLAGCGGDSLGRKPVTGSVTLDGQPVKLGNIAFTPMEATGIGSGGVITDGKFSIAKENGLPNGKYRVEIHASEGKAVNLSGSALPGDEIPAPEKELIPSKWNTESKETIEISDSGSTDFTFAVTTK